jgi:hypothetical protein
MTLKTINLPILITYVTLNFLLFAYCNGISPDFIGSAKLSEGGWLTFENPILVAALHLLALIFSYYLPEYMKNSVVYFRAKNPLPGCRAFTDLVHKDPRVDVSSLREEHGELPEDPKEQNRLWYKIYKTKGNKSHIRFSHGKWLLFRDMTSIALVFPPFLGIPTAIVGNTPLCWFYILALVAQYLVLAQVARNAGDRFVCNVLAD